MKDNDRSNSDNGIYRMESGREDKSHRKRFGDKVGPAVELAYARGSDHVYQ